MNKVLLSILVAIVLIAVIWGVYFLVSSSQQQGAEQVQSNQEQKTNQFVIEGMTVEVLKEGSGDAAVKSGDIISAHYKLNLQNGALVQSSYESGTPLNFEFREDTIIRGWFLGVTGMKVGEKRKLTIPPALGYGDIDLELIPANSTLIFEVELVDIIEQTQS